MNTLYISLMALGIVVTIAIALTLSVEGAGYLYMRDQVRALLKRSHATVPVQQPIHTEDEGVIVLH
jgi:hypothetical protein